MKVLFLPILLLAIAATLFAAAPVTQPSGEIIIKVIGSTNLNCHFIRIVGQKLTLDNQPSNWVQRVSYERWKTNGTPGITSRDELLLNVAQLAALYSAPNPRNALRNAVLVDAGVIEKP